MARTESAVDEFVTAIVNCAAQRKSDFFWHSAQGVLWFHFATAYSWWQQLNRRIGNSSAVARDALRVQLAERAQDYMVPAQTVSSKIMLGVDLKKAVGVGLDVPAEIAGEHEVTLRVGKETSW